MNRRLKHAAIIFIVVLAAAQLVRPERANPATDVSRTIEANCGRRADWLPSWIARAAIVTRTGPCGPGIPTSHRSRGSWRTV